MVRFWFHCVLALPKINAVVLAIETGKCSLFYQFRGGLPFSLETPVIFCIGHALQPNAILRPINKIVQLTHVDLTETIQLFPKYFFVASMA